MASLWWRAPSNDSFFNIFQKNHLNNQVVLFLHKTLLFFIFILRYNRYQKHFNPHNNRRRKERMKLKTCFISLLVLLLVLLATSIFAMEKADSRGPGLVPIVDYTLENGKIIWGPSDAWITLWGDTNDKTIEKNLFVKLRFGMTKAYRCASVTYNNLG